MASFPYSVCRLIWNRVTSYTPYSVSPVSVDLLDGVNFMVQADGVRLGVARERRSYLGGSSDYEDVLHEITLDIFGTGGEISDAIEDLTAIFAQVERWQNDQAPPIEFHFLPQGTDHAPDATSIATNIIVGLPKNQPSVELPSNYLNMLMIGEVQGVVLRFFTRGLWSTRQPSTASVAGISSAINEISMPGSLNFKSPCKVTFTLSSSGGADSTGGYVVLGDGEGSIVLLDSTDMLANNTVTLITDETAQGGNLMMLEGWYNSHNVTFSLPTLVEQEQTFSVYVKVRNLTGDNRWIWASANNHPLVSEGRITRRALVEGNKFGIIPVGIITLSKDDFYNYIRLHTDFPELRGESEGLIVDSILLADVNRTNVIEVENAFFNDTAVGGTLVFDHSYYKSFAPSFYKYGANKKGNVFFQSNRSKVYALTWFFNEAFGPTYIYSMSGSYQYTFDVAAERINGKVLPT